MTTSSTSNRVQTVDITISKNGRCIITDAGLEGFKKRNQPILKKAIGAIFKHFPIDIKKAALAFSKIYFTKENLCRTVNYPSRIPTNKLAKFRKKLLKTTKLSDKEALNHGIVSRGVKLKISAKGIDPATSPYYHAKLKKLKIVTDEIRKVLLPSAMFALPFPVERVKGIFANTQNTPNYTPHVKFKNKNNPLVISKTANTTVSRHVLPAFAWVKIKFQIITTLHKNFTMWTLWHDNRDLAFQFGGMIFLKLYVAKTGPGQNKPEVKEQTLAITCNASRHINGFIQGIARLAIGRIRESYNAAILTKKLYAVEKGGGK
ncbi:MAG: hypothetical protein ABIE74_07740 [Pseudomonadota bacterium]